MMRHALFLMLTMAPASLAIAAEGEGDPSLFAGTWPQSVAAIIVFLVLFTVLYKQAWGPILKGLQDREEKIKADLENAERASQEAAASLEEYKQKLAEAQRESQAILEKSRSDAEKVAAQIKNDAQTEITSMRERATNDISAAKEQAISEIYSQVADLSTQIAGRIIRKEITAEDQQQIVRESLNELTSNN